MLDLVGRDSRQLDELVASAVSRDHRDRTRWHAEGVREQLHDGGVRAPVLRRRRDADLPGLAVPADHRARSCTRRDAESKTSLHGGSLAPVYAASAAGSASPRTSRAPSSWARMRAELAASRSRSARAARTISRAVAFASST